MTDTSTTIDGLAAAPDAPAATGMSARDRLVIGLLLVATFVVILNETIMSVALPHLMADLAIPASTAQWLTTAFVPPVSAVTMLRTGAEPTVRPSSSRTGTRCSDRRPEIGATNNDSTLKGRKRRPASSGS